VPTPKTELERLRALEWDGKIAAYAEDLADVCPVCERGSPAEVSRCRDGRSMFDLDELGDGHEPNCWLAARIAELEGGDGADQSEGAGQVS